MESKASSKSIMLNYGLVLGVIGVLYGVILYATGQLITLGWTAFFVSLISMIVVLSLGIKKFRHDNNNLLSWGQAVKVGIGISIVSAVIGIIYNLIFLNFIEPTFMEQTMEIQRQAWSDAGLSQAEMDQAESMAKTFSGPVFTSAMSILAAAFIGFIISAIAGAVMKRSAEDGY